MATVYHSSERPATPTPTDSVAHFRPVPTTLERLRLSPGEVHVWIAPESAPCPTAPLTIAEQTRADRYTHTRARNQFTRCRGLLRALLAAYLDCDSSTVRIVVAPDGKPTLDAEVPPLQFNVSHTDGLVLVAIASVPVGVDTERWRSIPSADDLVRRYFGTSEQRQYQELPELLRPAAFLRGWTCKEAVLKGVGCGARGLDRCVVELDPRSPARVVELGGQAAKLGPDWQLVAGRLLGEFAVALAVHGAGELRVVSEPSVQ